MKFSLLKLLLLTLLFISVGPPSSFAQKNKKVAKAAIRTNDGNFYVGKVIVHYGDRIVIKDREIGEITIDIEDIKRIKYFKERSDKSETTIYIEENFWNDNPIYSNHFIGSNAFNLKKGKWVYRNAMLLYNSLTYGFTDNFSIEFGLLIPIPVFDRIGPNIFINPKFTIPIEGGFNIGFGNGFGFVNGEWINLPYIVGTVGSKSRNISLSMGYGITSFDGITDAPIVSLSGTYRVSKTVALITENWYTLPSGEGLTRSGVFSYGVRFIFKNTVLDLALANNEDLSDFMILGFPILHIATSFGKRR